MVESRGGAAAAPLVLFQSNVVIADRNRMPPDRIPAPFRPAGMRRQSPGSGAPMAPPAIPPKTPLPYLN